MKKNSVWFSLTIAFLLLVRPIFAETFNQAMQLQLADITGAPVENTQFWVTVQIIKQKNQITLNFPTINFEVRQCASRDPECSLPSPGYIITTAGFLPPGLRHNLLVPVSVNAASGDGLAQTATRGATPPTPPPGFIVSIDNSGGVLIQQAGASQNVISPGHHILLPCSVTYLAEKRENICFNFQLSQGQIDVSQFTTQANNNIRDSHINDSFDNTFAWTWTDNHNLDQTANTLNAFVVVGKIDKKGRLKLGNPIQLTNFPSNIIAWDTSVAINRQDKNNIVVSYGFLRADGESKTCRAVSFDGGKTWGGVFDGVNSLPNNGVINEINFGDIPGVGADRYGNFWYGVTDNTIGTNIPYLLVSTDKGATWTIVFNFTSVTGSKRYDYPHLVFGGNGSGQYGVWYYADYFNDANDIFPAVAFIPITGLGSFGTPSITFLDAFPNSIASPAVEASSDGRFWALGPTGYGLYFLNQTFVALFKSPGPIDQNYAGPWITGSQNQLNEISTNLYQFASVPDQGYFLSVQGLIYDEKRKALYGLFSAQYPPLSQNMRLYFSISRNNGQTWSNPFDISATSFANRGFESMSLDPASGNIYLGWYDGRNDSSLKKIQYFGGIIPAQLLDRLVKQIPLSNPQYKILGQGMTMPPP